MGKNKQRKEDNVIKNTNRIEASGFDLHYFSDIHVRIDDRVDLWLSTGTWHIKNQKSESKCYNEMIKYLENGNMDKEIKEPHTPEEKKIGDLLVEACNLMLKLESTHPCHEEDFADGIHKCQDVLIHRVIQRDYPDTYPIK